MISVESLHIRNDRKHGPSAAAHRVRAGFTRTDLAVMFLNNGFTKGAEIGVADGRYSLTLCQANPNLELLCVDPWMVYRGNPRGGPSAQHAFNLELAKRRLTPYRATLVKGFSMDVVQNVPLESLDFAYIDGNHCYEHVLNDLTEWSKRVRCGGIVAGHDFYEFQWAGVIEAVNEYTVAQGITDWWLCDEREPSFFWVKP